MDHRLRVLTLLLFGNEQSQLPLVVKTARLPHQKPLP